MDHDARRIKRTLFQLPRVGAEAEELRAALRRGSASLVDVEALSSLGHGPATLLLGTDSAPPPTCVGWDSLPQWTYGIAVRSCFFTLEWLLSQVSPEENPELLKRWRLDLDVAEAIASLAPESAISSGVPSHFVAGRMIRVTQELGSAPIHSGVPLSVATADAAVALGTGWTESLIESPPAGRGSATRGCDPPVSSVPFRELIQLLSPIELAPPTGGESLTEYLLDCIAGYLVLGKDLLDSAIRQRAYLSSVSEADPLPDWLLENLS